MAKTLVLHVRVVGVQAEGAPSMVVSLKQGEVVELPSIATVADGIAVRRPGDINFSIVRDTVDDVVTVTDGEIRQAMTILLKEACVVAEPAGAAGVAALLAGKFKPEKVAAIVITGGNVSPALLGEVLAL